MTGIPDTVPDLLMGTGRAPSYREVALCLLKNDINLIGLGNIPDSSQVYSAIKRDEISRRTGSTGNLF